MLKKKMPQSLRKYIRKEKARIRRESLDLKKQKKLISDLYRKYENRGNSQTSN